VGRAVDVMEENYIRIKGVAKQLTAVHFCGKVTFSKYFQALLENALPLKHYPC
jgi:hypothetical protein